MWRSVNILIYIIKLSNNEQIYKLKSNRVDRMTFQNKYEKKLNEFLSYFIKKI